MSHLSILPTVLQDADCLTATLEALGLAPVRGGRLEGFPGTSEPVDLQVRLPEGLPLGWRRQADGSLAVVGDLQRLSRSRAVQDLLGRITRDYAARRALQEAARCLPGARLHVGA
ncbi:MAG: DUF1257 domain-containing protein [Synechococcaceae cyanobacterium]|nr:DUF1257 domain-containing protein [Synechococcaceae cyanobacterium]